MNIVTQNNEIRYSQEMYARAYVSNLLNCLQVQPPDHAFSGSYAELLDIGYRAHQKGGPDNARNALQDAAQRRPEWQPLLSDGNVTPSRFSVLTVEDLRKLPPLKWLIDSMLPAKSLCEMHGAPGVGKSLVALDLAATVGQSKSVLYVAAEGISGYGARIDAWQTTNGREIGQVFFVQNAVHLMDEADVTTFIASIQHVKPALVVIDTLARSFVGGDENSAEDMGRVIAHCKRIQDALGATVLLVHHTTKSTGTERGSSALRGAADSMIEVANQNGVVVVSSSKLKDGSPFPTRYYRMEAVGSSVALVPTTRTAGAGKSLTNPERQVLEMLDLEIFTVGAKHRRIIDHTGLSSSTLDRALSALKQQGYIEQSKKGEPYFITELGRSQIAL